MWLVMLTSRNYEELYATLGYIMNDYNRNKFIRKVIELSSDDFIMSSWDEEMWVDYVIYQNSGDRIKEEEQRKKDEKWKIENEKELKSIIN